MPRRAGSNPPTSGYRRQNRASWDRWARSYERRHATALARAGGAAWGLWRIPEHRVRLLGPLRGKDVLELGCGAGWWSIALARQGARVVGLDFSPARLDQARVLGAAARARVTWVSAPAEQLPFPDARFDVVLSDYGATTFADPRRWIPEVGRVLRPGGSFVFAHASPFRSLAEDLRRDRLEPRLLRPYFGLHVLRDRDCTEFQLPYGEWIERFASAGLSVERLVERPAPPGTTTSYVGPEDLGWARRWPMESIWKLRKGERSDGHPPRRARARDR